jgi:hypothetical protein
VPTELEELEAAGDPPPPRKRPRKDLNCATPDVNSAVPIVEVEPQHE